MAECMHSNGYSLLSDNSVIPILSPEKRGLWNSLWSEKCWMTGGLPGSVVRCQVFQLFWVKWNTEFLVQRYHIVHVCFFEPVACVTVDLKFCRRASDRSSRDGSGTRD